MKVHKCDCCGKELDLTDIDVYKYKMFERKSIVDDEPFHKVDRGVHIFM